MGREHTWRRYAKEGLAMAAIAVVLVALLPVLAVAVFTTRVVIVAILVGIAALFTSRRFRDALFADEVDPQVYKGLRVPEAVMLGDGHAWARVTDRTVTVGADDLVQAALGPVDRVELPEVGAHIERDALLFSLHHGDRRLEIRSPVAGRIAQTNSRLQAAPRLVNEAPYGGWAVEVMPDDMQGLRRTLHRGRQARDWFRSEVDRLIAMASSGRADAVMLQDGGTVTPELYREIDASAWNRIANTLFGSRCK